MKQRCNYPNHVEFHRYGGRGITYSKRWESFDNFFEDMGEKPSGHSIDRIDINGNYCKENCKWSNKHEQSSNTSRNIKVQWEGKEFTLKELAEHIGVSYDRLHRWHRTNNLPLDEAVQWCLKKIPVGYNKPYSL